MKGDIAFAGFMITADEWQQLDAQSRAQLIAVATRRMEPWPAPQASPVIATGTVPPPFAEASGPVERDEFIELDLESD